MDETNKHINNTEIKQTIKPLPLLVKAAALLLIVYGIIGLSYYLFDLVYSIINPHFLESLKFKNFVGKTLFIPIIIEILVHISVVLAGFLIFYKKKSGLYFYYFSLFFSLIFFILFLNHINFAEIIIGSILLLILFLYRSHLY